jgi:dipeptidyl aminopeptidase/acylaminoacyl peptidase
VTRSFFLRVFLAWMCLWLPSSAVWSLDEIDPGELPVLDPDEGLVLVAVDSAQALYGLRLGREGRMLSSAFLKRLPQGRSHRLFKARAGEYQWMDVQPFLGWRFRLREDPEFRFRVEPGTVNYPGDLRFQASNLFRAQLRTANRASAALDWMRRSHPHLLDRHGFRYAGAYPDPFPKMYLAALHNATGAADPAVAPESSLLSPPEPTDLPLPPDRLWQHRALTDLALSPDGRFLAVQLSSPAKDSKGGQGLNVESGSVPEDTGYEEGDGESGEQDPDWRVELLDLETGDRHLIARSPMSYASVTWSGVDRLVLEVGLFGDRIIEVVRIERTEETGAARFELVQLPKRGELISPLPAEPDNILFASFDRRGQLMVHRVDVSSQERARAFKGNRSDRLNRGVKNDLWWLVDGRGELRVAVVEKDDKRVLLHGADGRFETEIELDDTLGFNPFALSHEGDTLYGTSDRDRDQLDLVEYDIASRRISKTLFSRAGVDVNGIVSDAAGQLIGVTFYQQGRRQTEYFAEADRREEAALQAALPGRSLATAARSTDGRQRVLWVDGPETPPQLFHFDGERRSLSPVMAESPWLEGLQFASTRSLSVEADDGTQLEAFLTLPQGTGPYPLVLFPHGGPIGIADRLHFDLETQFLASLGYAVLQVNFRGSDGYGRAFREAGRHNFGRLIEDDIDAALRAVLASEPIDPRRMCVLGASYGGYSALVASLRWPGRFRCAVSINGPTDLPLLFTASDVAASAKSRERMEEIIGKPREALDPLIQTSPAYHAQELKTPLMLVQGERDQRVDPEHARRLMRMLQIHGIEVSGLWLEGEGHSLGSLANTRRMWRGIAGFLQTHLKAPPPQAERSQRAEGATSESRHEG